MKPTKHHPENQMRRCGIFLLGLGAAVSTVSAADTNKPPAEAPAPMTPEQMFEGGTQAYNNWIEFSTGGVISSGNRARFQQQHQIGGAAFGGIEGLHYGTNLNKTTTLTLDARAIFDENDYKVKLSVEREKVGYLRLTYRKFRTWSDGDGGFFPPTGMNFALGNNELGLDRGSFSLEGGLTPEKGWNAIFKYTHNFREGEKDSTSWGDVNLAGGALTRGLSPSYYDIHEHSDSFQLDLSNHIKSTDVGLGLRYEMGKLDDAMKITQFPQEPLQQKVTSQQGTSYDVADVHGFTETAIKPNLVLSSGFSYSHLDNSFFGSRIYGSDFDVGYAPNPQYGFGYYNLSGHSRLNEYVMDLNLLYKPAPALTIIPSVRLQKDDSNADSTGFETLGANAFVPFGSHGDAGDLDVRGRLDLAYKGFTNWVLHACSMDLTEADGNLNQYGGLIPIGGAGVPRCRAASRAGILFRNTRRGVRWYPARRVTVDAGGYLKLNTYDYDRSLDSTVNTGPDRYPGYLAMQKFSTYDGNLRLTYRPWQNVSLSSRYEYQWSTIHTAPDAVAGLPNVESSTMRTHILAQDASWTPWSRLCLQAGFNYVFERDGHAGVPSHAGDPRRAK